MTDDAGKKVLPVDLPTLNEMADEIEAVGLREFVARRKDIPHLAGKRIVVALRTPLPATASREAVVLDALKFAKIDLEAARVYISNREGTPYGILQTQAKIDEALAVLALAPLQSATREAKGWQLVPTEATPDMVRAAPWISNVRYGWKQMLAAAPALSTVPADERGEGK